MKNISYFVKVYGGSKDPGFSYFFDYVSFHGFIWTIIVLSVISMISNCLMLYGIRKNIPAFLIAWLSINLILLIVSTYMRYSPYANFIIVNFITVNQCCKCSKSALENRTQEKHGFFSNWKYLR